MAARRKLSHRITRFWQWLKQVILLGRADWRKASDDASPQRLSQIEREELSPHFDVSAIRPRSISAADRTVRTDPPPNVPATFSTPAVEETQPARPDSSPMRKSRVFRRKRRDRSQRPGANPLAAFSSDKRPATRFERLMQKLLGRDE